MRIPWWTRFARRRFEATADKRLERLVAEHYRAAQTVEPGAPRDWVVTAPIELAESEPSITRSAPRILMPGTRLRYEHVRVQTYFEYDGTMTTARCFLILDGPYAGDRVDSHEWCDPAPNGEWLAPKVPFPQPGLEPVDGTWPPVAPPNSPTST